jgi:hypothetical protein
MARSLSGREGGAELDVLGGIAGKASAEALQGGGYSDSRRYRSADTDEPCPPFGLAVHVPVSRQTGSTQSLDSRPSARRTSADDDNGSWPPEHERV